MIYDIHTHHHPITPGTAIVQLTPDAFSLQPGHFYSVGLHPWDIGDDWRIQMGKLLVMALQTHVLMIGEAGLDKKHGCVPLDMQMEVFREHVFLSELIRKPLIVHCVKAFDELLAIRKETKATMPWIIHGFRGGVEQWQQLVRSGIHISIGRHYNASLVCQLPQQHLLLESDDSTEVELVYDLVSNDTEIDRSALSRLVADNIYSLFTAASDSFRCL